MSDPGGCAPRPRPLTTTTLHDRRQRPAPPVDDPDVHDRWHRHRPRRHRPGAEPAGRAWSPPANEPFEFAQVLPVRVPLSLTVTSQPVEPTQICTVTDGEGTVLAPTSPTSQSTASPPHPTSSSTRRSAKTPARSPPVSSPAVPWRQAMAVQPDGKIVLAGEKAGEFDRFPIARYNPDGTLDDTFDDTGILTTASTKIRSGKANHSSMSRPIPRVASSSRMPNIGTGTTNFAVARLVYGSTDETFGTGGRTSSTSLKPAMKQTPWPFSPTARSSWSAKPARWQRGDVAVARDRHRRHPRQQLRRRRHRSRHHRHRRRARPSQRRHHRRRRQHRGRRTLLVDRSLDHFAVVRYTPAGILDSAFASDGITEIDLGVPGGIDIDADTKIVVAGTHNSGIATCQSNFALWRFTSTGDRDRPSTATGSSPPTSRCRRTDQTRRNRQRPHPPPRRQDRRRRTCRLHPLLDRPQHPRRGDGPLPNRRRPRHELRYPAARSSSTSLQAPTSATTSPSNPTARSSPRPPPPTAPTPNSASCASTLIPPHRRASTPPRYESATPEHRARGLRRALSDSPPWKHPRPTQNSDTRRSRRRRSIETRCPVRRRRRVTPSPPDRNRSADRRTGTLANRVPVSASAKAAGLQAPRSVRLSAVRPARDVSTQPTDGRSPRRCRTTATRSRSPPSNVGDDHRHGARR